ncbi:LysM domain-containing protein [Micromonospora sp. NPDC049523]|uniref:LysM peptidoglycan-binding domain-containing protein n=1 Tax=Micromonospora sp. NPDC049523 TaxID=3155921 RepID=UPI00341B0F0D
MPAARVSAARRTGQFLTGFCSLLILVGLIAGAPIALLAFAGNPLPDHVPTLAEVGSTLTSRDDGQLFLRALAIVGWVGWATFALSVLVELPARILRRPAVRLPGMRRQQRAAAALVGAVALILVASPAATAATSVAAGTVATAPHSPSARPALAIAGPATATTTEYAPTAWASAPYGRTAAAPVAAPATTTAAAPRALAAPNTPADEPAPVYRVEDGDYLGTIADRYLGDFERYQDLARLNEIRNPDRIKPGQLLHLPADAADQGIRKHATGMVAIPPPPGGHTEAPTNGWPTPEKPPAPPAQPAPQQPREPSEVSTYAVGASRASEVNNLNRPLAVSAVIAVASIVGAQIGAVLGLRRRPATGTLNDAADGGRHRRG